MRASLAVALAANVAVYSRHAGPIANVCARPYPSQFGLSFWLLRPMVRVTSAAAQKETS